MKKEVVSKKSGVGIMVEVPESLKDIETMFIEKEAVAIFMRSFKWIIQGKMDDDGSTDTAEKWIESVRKPDPVATLMKVYLGMGMDEDAARDMVRTTLEKVAKK